MRYLLPFVMFFCCWSVLAQPISTFPYIENFDSFPIGVQGSVAEPNPDAFPGGWINEQAGDDAQDWYSVAGSTPSSITGPASDHTTGSGLYLYVEDSGNGANNDSVDLLSPQFDITNLPNPTLSVWVHSLANTPFASFGGDSSLNDLKIEVLFNGTWNELDSIGDLVANWTQFYFDLSAYPGVIQVRFRVNNNNFGDLIHDIAIDDFSIFGQPDYDAELLKVSPVLIIPSTYTLAPVSQSAGYRFSGTVVNNGSSPITQVKVKETFGTYLDSVILPSIPSQSAANFISSNLFFPSQTITGQLEVSIAETDGNTSNNLKNLTLIDSVFARDDSIAEIPVNFGESSDEFGNLFELTDPDTLTSASVYLLNPAAGSQFRLMLYGFGNQAIGRPDDVALDSTGLLTASGAGWYNLKFTCPIALPPGQYLMAAKQISSNSMGIGLDIDNSVVGTSFFREADSIWKDFSNINFNSVPTVRMNFGLITGAAAITPSLDSYCVGDTIELSSSGSGNFVWDGPNVLSSSANTARALPPSPGVYSYSVQLQTLAGCLFTDTVAVRVNPLPMASIAGDTLICTGDTATLMASGGVSYAWSTGETSSTLLLPVNANTTVSVAVTDTNGCQALDTLEITAAPVPSVTLTSTDDNGVGDGTASASVTGGTPPYLFRWNDPLNQPGSTAFNLTAGTYTVTVTDANGCQAIDSVVVNLFVSIGDEISRASFSVYPNPASDQLIIQDLTGIETGVQVELSLSDLNGKLILRRRVINSKKMEVDLPAGLADGLYQLELKADRSRGVKRISIRQ